jgi:glycerol kinase
VHPSEPLILGIDQGTTGTTCLLATCAGEIRARAHREVAVQHPRPGWVEQDPMDLLASVLAASGEALQAGEAAAVGITNQRETVVVFDRRTLEPVGPAIVWQDRRTAELCEAHRRAGEEAELRRRTGLLLDPYFSATKIEWLLRQDPDLRRRAEAGDLCATTVDAWLVARLTDGSALATDASNASRTLLYDLRRGDFDPDLCALFDIPPAVLPPIVSSAGRVGFTDPSVFHGRRLPISGLAGDQQAALFGQACVTPGTSKNTYGTGSFVLVNVGEVPAEPGHGLLTTVAWRLDGRDTFALEGSIFVTGAALRWLRDGLHLIERIEEVGALFDSVEDSRGCTFVPALAGLGAPYWDAGARGAFLGLSAGVERAHLVRAVVESMALRTRDVVEAMEQASGVAFRELRVDGGASLMDGLCQFQADLLGLPVARAATSDATALGAAWLAAVGEGLIGSAAEAAAGWKPGRRFLPAAPGVRPVDAYRRWREAVDRVRS